MSAAKTEILAPSAETVGTGAGRSELVGPAVGWAVALLEDAREEAELAGAELLESAEEGEAGAWFSVVEAQALRVTPARRARVTLAVLWGKETWSEIMATFDRGFMSSL